MPSLLLGFAYGYLSYAVQAKRHLAVSTQSNLSQWTNLPFELVFVHHYEPMLVVALVDLAAELSDPSLDTKLGASSTEPIAY